MLRTSALLRSLPTTSRAVAIRSQFALAQRSTQIRRDHAVSNPTLADIERRWPVMPPQEQAELWMALRDRMKNDWHELTTQEKKASYWIAFGPHGPRAPLYEKGIVWTVIKALLRSVAISVAIIMVLKYFARKPPSTMNQEWQEATEAYLKEQNVEPISGISSPSWKGNFSVQSAPKKPE